MSNPVCPLARVSSLVVVASLVARVAGADPEVHARWYSSVDCVSGPLDLTILPGSSSYLTLHVLGALPPNQGIEFDVTIRDGGGGALADAWRFDGEGCQPDDSIQLETVYLVDPFNRCQYAGDFLLQQLTRSVVYEPATNGIRARLRATWPLWQPTQLKYRLGKVTFDHSSSVNGAAGSGECGGLERGVCLAIAARRIDENGVLHDWPVATPFLTANGGGSLACDAVPTAPTTWGAIKVQYR